MLDVLLALGAAAAALAAIGVVLLGVSRLRPVKWLWRTLVTDPVSHWFRAEVSEVVEPILQQVRNNGGSSMKDQLDQIVADREIDAADRDRRKVETDGRFTSIEDRLSDGSEHLASIDAQLASFGRIVEQWRGTHPEIRPDPEDPVDD